MSFEIEYRIVLFGHPEHIFHTSRKFKVFLPEQYFPKNIALKNKKYIILMKTIRIKQNKLIKSIQLFKIMYKYILSVLKKTFSRTQIWNWFIVNSQNRQFEFDQSPTAYFCVVCY